MNKSPFHIQLIREMLSKRQRANSSYSLRAYGRDLGMDPSTLSAVLKGKRSFPIKDCDRVIKSLRLTPIEKMHFMESALKKRALLDQIKTDAQEKFMLDESHYRVIAEWEHYAVLTFANIENAKLETATLSKKFGMTKLRAQSVLQNLINAKLLTQNEDGSLSKTHDAVRTTEDITSEALRASHLEALELSKQKLESIPVELRDYSSLNIAFDPAQLTELKAIIREFRQKVSTLAKSGENKSEVYQLAIQLYPLTKIENETQEKKNENQ
jgi:uncharacterized protein (TIGR02147 family)